MTNTLTPTSADFRTVKKLNGRLDLNRDTDRDILVSICDLEVPKWQRQVVWTSDEMGLLAYSIIINYPIGMLILWKKSDGVRVPIDGRQRMTAIKLFYEGKVAIPAIQGIPGKYHNKKYKLLEGDDTERYGELDLEDKESFDDYELSIKQYDGLDEEKAMDIFIRLQGGKCLSKTEIRAALGGKVCDFITELTSGITITVDGDDEEIPEHKFFTLISSNIKNTRKAHRNIADIMFHESLYPNKNKHWTSLEGMYREKSNILTTSNKDEFRGFLNSFQKSVTIDLGNGNQGIIKQLRSVHFILTVFKVWLELKKNYDTPNDFLFAEQIIKFEIQRASNPDDLPWINFTSALSNAGYSEERICKRHDILLEFILRNNPDISAKDRDPQRLFTMHQKIAIWELADHQCEYEEDGERCPEIFDNPRDADADHIVRWDQNGTTAVSNGRLLCQSHNRGG